MYGIGLFTQPVLDRANKETISDLTGATKEQFIEYKRDCERSGKECAMIWDFVEVEADY
jgi:hypothetical protein